MILHFLPYSLTDSVRQTLLMSFHTRAEAVDAAINFARKYRKNILVFFGQNLEVEVVYFPDCDAFTLQYGETLKLPGF